ncbi:MAG TPA: malic enzyme-like NAD(P)-binding protein [Thermoleophilaceae bacterium]|nr:malic enzyme-like NAD(P)-binding protein [Thermoleophilaceae bacterium]
MLDATYRVQIRHRPGQLAKVAQAIGEREGLIGDVMTVTLGREASIRELTVEVRDDHHAEDIAERLNALDGVRVLWLRDRALMRHEGGKLTVEPRIEVRTLQDTRDIYTPGVARVARAIADDGALANRYTTIGRTVAICTNGTRVLGLGDIGPRAAMPVMEGKAVFYTQVAGISAVPVLIDASQPDEFVATVKRIAPTFGGIHLEDISAPECFEIERRLIDELPIPVMHDDVHGTAVVVLAAVIVACREVGIELDRATVGQLGLGAAGFGIAALMVDAGVERVVASDPEGTSHARAVDKGIAIAELDEVMATADVVVATTGRPGLIEPDTVRYGQVIFALTNPDPEIRPDDALAAGAAFALEGSIVNNVLGYPGIFRGALLAGAEDIDLEMKLAAARAIADLGERSELVPDPLDPIVHEQVAEAVREAAERSGAARPELAAPGL